jgi:hypothetical protein
MDVATRNRKVRSWDAFLAGLQAGLVGVLWMLAWLGMSSVLERRGFWTAENLLASAFYGNAAMGTGFRSSTLSGLALYVLIYSSLGALFAAAVQDRLPRLRLTLAAAVCGLAWYYLTFQVLWKSLLPVAALLHSRSATVLGHVLYGVMVARFPAYLPRAATPAGEPIATHEAPGLAGDLPCE